MATESSTLTEMSVYSEKHQAMNEELDDDIAAIREESKDTKAGNGYVSKLTSTQFKPCRNSTICSLPVF
jgi:hypothetical protein